MHQFYLSKILDEYANVIQTQLQGILEKNIGNKAIKNFTEIQPGDVIKTYANTEKLQNWINYSPSTTIEEGVKLFINWYKDYYVIK